MPPWDRSDSAEETRLAGAPQTVTASRAVSAMVLGSVAVVSPGRLNRIAQKGGSVFASDGWRGWIVLPTKRADLNESQARTKLRERGVRLAFPASVHLVICTYAFRVIAIALGEICKSFSRAERFPDAKRLVL